jgi:sugar phosphate isomerase/epimerase
MLTPNFSRLHGTLGLGALDEAAFAAHCAAMRDLGYAGVYFNDLFFRIVPPTPAPLPGQLLFTEDSGHLVYRDEADLAAIGRILADHGLTTVSAHFLQTLPPPGYAMEWIFPIHERLLDLAAAIGLERVTTHIGFMFGIANRASLGTAAERFQRGELPLAELCALARQTYGPARFRDDSVAIYRHLCREAARRGIVITIETACMEALDFNTTPQTLAAFIAEIGEPNLRACLDPGHCYINGVDIPAMIRGLGPLLAETHFHDNFGDADRHNPIGIGTLDWRAIILAMHETGYAGPITFEQGDYRLNAPNWRLMLREAERGLTNPGGH